jgi:hypothetical protein
MKKSEVSLVSTNKSNNDLSTENELCRNHINVQRWVRNEFMRVLHVSDIKDVLMRKAVSRINLFKSHMRRYEQWNIMTYMLVPGVNIMTCSMVKIKNINIAYIYSAYHPIKKEMDLLYLCTGVNMLSADGEYRGRFIRIYNTTEIALIYPEFINKLEVYINSRKYDANILHFISPSHKDYTTSINDKISGVLNSVICVVWFCEMYLMYFNIQSNHKNPLFNVTMFNTDDIKFFKELIHEHGDEFIIRIYQWFTVTLGNTPIIENTTRILSLSVECGQKLIPLKVKDVQNPMNPLRRIWREIIIWQMLSKLPLNLITPGLPVFNLWFIIHNSRSELFNNPYMNEKFTLSDSSPDISDDESGDISDTDVIGDEDISDITLAIVCESTGSTINSTLMFHKSSEYMKRNKDLFAQTTYFMKYLFEIIYTLYCMNTKCGVIHADLHRNNTTMNSLYFPFFDYGSSELTVSPLPTDRVVYHVGDGLHYAFPHIVKIGSVIDFSRSIIKIDEIKDKFYTNDDMVTFQNRQVLYIANWYRVYFPDLFNTYESKIMWVINNRFDKVFKIVSAMDAYKHSLLLNQFFEKHANLGIGNAATFKVLKKINTITRHYLESGMKTLALNPEWECTEWPNMDIIKRCFNEFLVSGSDMVNLQIVDFFNYDNDSTYEFYKPEKYPPRIDNKCVETKDWPEKGEKIICKHIDYKEIRIAYNNSIIDWTNRIKAFQKKA